MEKKRSGADMLRQSIEEESGEEVKCVCKSKDRVFTFEWLPVDDQDTEKSVLPLHVPKMWFDRRSLETPDQCVSRGDEDSGQTKGSAPHALGLSVRRIVRCNSHINNSKYQGS